MKENMTNAIKELKEANFELLVREIRNDIDSELEPSREKALTLTKLDEAILWLGRLSYIQLEKTIGSNLPDIVCKMTDKIIVKK